MARTATKTTAKRAVKKTTATVAEKPVAISVPAVEAENKAALDKARKESAPMTVKLVGAHSYSGGGAPFFRKGGTATLAARAAKELLATGLFEEVK